MWNLVTYAKFTKVRVHNNKKACFIFHVTRFILFTIVFFSSFLTFVGKPLCICHLKRVFFCFSFKVRVDLSWPVFKLLLNFYRSHSMHIDSCRINVEFHTYFTAKVSPFVIYKYSPFRKITSSYSVQSVKIHLPYGKTFLDHTTILNSKRFWSNYAQIFGSELKNSRNNIGFCLNITDNDNIITETPNPQNNCPEGYTSYWYGCLKFV